jgi:nucleotide-binding universal stress UspA family protein
MFERILLAIDGSAASARAIPVTTEIAGRFQARVTVLHVMEHEPLSLTDVELETQEEANRLVDDAVRGMKEAGVSADAELRRAAISLTPLEILRTASDDGADLIVVGCRGLTDWQGLLLGSVAHKVIHHASCPVLVVR